MKRVPRCMIRAAMFAAFMAPVGYFSTSPVYSPLTPGEAVIKLSFAHQGRVAGECRQRSAEELAKLPPNMRAPLDCARRRAPVRVQLEIDGSLRLDRSIAPSGLSGDGASYLYERFVVPAGEHRLQVRLGDRSDGEGFDYQRSDTVRLRERQVLVIDFDAQHGGFELH